MKRFLPLLALLSLLIAPVQAARADSSEHITDFSSIATLSANNVLQVQETITIDFGAITHHGVYRDIPIIERSGSDVYYYQFALDGVTSGSGAPAGVASLSQIGDNEEIKIGDPNKTVVGVQSYTITYRLTPFALHNGSTDRVILNITGQDWAYPIDQASLQLTLPAAPTTTPVCYTGPTGSVAQDCAVSQVGNVVSVHSLVGFDTGSGMTVDMSLPGGSFSKYLVANQRPPLSTAATIWHWLDLAGLLLALATFFRLLWLAASNGNLKRRQTVVAQYDAPDGLTPGQIGLLADSKSGMRELTAIIIDLSVRGYMKITRTDKKVLFITSHDYQFDQLKPVLGLKAYEHTVLAMFFNDTATGQSIKLSEVATQANATANKSAISSMRKQLATSLEEAGYFGSKADLVNRYGWTSILIGIVLITVALIAPDSGVIAMMTVASAVFIAASLYFVTRYPRLTPEGAAEWAKVEGLKLYLSVAEKDRLNFTDAPERTPEQFNKLLPYAVALGVEKQWAKQFEGIDMSASGSGYNAWYVGQNFSSAAFASSFAGSLASSMNSSFAASSGGGFAGGGGGGGGGGGW